MTRLKFHSGRKRRDVPFEPILCVKLLIVAKIEKHGVMHQQRVVNYMRPYGENAAFEWAEPCT
jgi:hypothetical protein